MCRVVMHRFERLSAMSPEKRRRTLLMNYDTSRPAPYRPGATRTIIYIGEWQGRRLKVYVEEGSNPLKVKTVAWEGE